MLILRRNIVEGEELFDLDRFDLEMLANVAFRKVVPRHTASLRLQRRRVIALRHVQWLLGRR